MKSHLPEQERLNCGIQPLLEHVILASVVPLGNRNPGVEHRYLRVIEGNVTVVDAHEGHWVLFSMPMNSTLLSMMGFGQAYAVLLHCQFGNSLLWMVQPSDPLHSDVRMVVPELWATHQSPQGQAYVTFVPRGYTPPSVVFRITAAFGCLGGEPQSAERFRTHT